MVTLIDNESRLVLSQAVAAWIAHASEDRAANVAAYHGDAHYQGEPNGTLADVRRFDSACS